MERTRHFNNRTCQGPRSSDSFPPQSFRLGKEPPTSARQLKKCRALQLCHTNGGSHCRARRSLYLAGGGTIRDTCHTNSSLRTTAMTPYEHTFLSGSVANEAGVGDVAIVADLAPQYIRSRHFKSERLLLRCVPRESPDNDEQRPTRLISQGSLPSSNAAFSSPRHREPFPWSKPTPRFPARHTRTSGPHLHRPNSLIIQMVKERRRKGNMIYLEIPRVYETLGKESLASKRRLDGWRHAIIQNAPQHRMDQNGMHTCTSAHLLNSNPRICYRGRITIQARFPSLSTLRHSYTKTKKIPFLCADGCILGELDCTDAKFERELIWWQVGKSWER